MDIKINENGYLSIENNDLAIVENDDSIIQDIRRALHTIKGEVFLNSAIGINYFGSILVNNPDSVIIKAEIRNSILNRPGVNDISKFLIEIDGETREMTITTIAITDDGEINYVGSL